MSGGSGWEMVEYEAEFERECFNMAEGHSILLCGVGGQGILLADPSQSAFTDHAVVTWGTTIYDPSYGLSFNNLLDWQRNALDAVGYFNDYHMGMSFSVNSGNNWPIWVYFHSHEP